MSLEETLRSELARLNLSLSNQVQEKLLQYVRELEHWNKSVNLTALSDASLIERLIVEPVWIGQELQLSGVLADIGSGNGCPAIPLVITRGFHRAHLVEARTKRAAFLRHVASKIGLKEIEVHRSRLEDLAEPIENVDWITLQAVNPTPQLLSSLGRVSSATTRVVWITSTADAPISSAKKISVPGSNTRAWIFGLDQF